MESLDTKVFKWIQDRYDYYDELYNEGKDAGEKYENKVFKDASEHFKLKSKEIDSLYFTGSTNYYK